MGKGGLDVGTRGKGGERSLSRIGGKWSVEKAELRTAGVTLFSSSAIALREGLGERDWDGGILLSNGASLGNAAHSQPLFNSNPSKMPSEHGCTVF